MKIGKKQYNRYKVFFYSVMALSVALFLLLGILSEGRAFSSLFFKDKTDTFMDHLNSTIYNEIDPYENSVIYPPLASFSYKLCNVLIPDNIYEPIIDDPTVKSQPDAMRTLQGFMFPFFMYCIISLFLFAASADSMKKGGKPEKFVFTLFFALSGPFLFMAERGNNVIIPIAFSMFFIAFYDSKNKFLREFALISLALATGFKIYPIALGVLLLRNKQYAELIRAGIYCVITLIVPFFIFYNGFESMFAMLRHIVGFSSSRSSSGNIETQLDFKRAFYFLYGGSRKVTGIYIDSERLDVYADIFKNLCTIVCVGSTFFAKKRWKVVMLCAAFIYGFSGSCTTYLLTFFAPAIILMLDEEKEFTWLNFIYLGIMTVTQMPLLFYSAGTWNRYWPTKITSAAVIVIVFLMFLEMLFSFIIWNYNRIKEGKGFFASCMDRIIEFFPDALIEKINKRKEARTDA